MQPISTLECCSRRAIHRPLSVSVSVSFSLSIHPNPQLRHPPMPPSPLLHVAQDMAEVDAQLSQGGKGNGGGVRGSGEALKGHNVSVAFFWLVPVVSRSAENVLCILHLLQRACPMFCTRFCFLRLLAIGVRAQEDSCCTVGVRRAFVVSDGLFCLRPALNRERRVRV